MSTSYRQSNLTSDVGKTAEFTDPTLVDPWGVAISGDIVWTAVNGSNLLSGFSKDGRFIRSVATTGSGSGLVVSSDGFPGLLIVVTENGTIEVYNPFLNPLHTTTVINDPTSVFKGAAIYDGLLYVTNFSKGVVWAYNKDFIRVPAFDIKDDTLSGTVPADINYNPFNVYAYNDSLYISYAQTDAMLHDDVKGIGNGYVNVHHGSTNVGTLQRLISRGTLNSPWGMVRYKHKLYVGNFGDGLINIFRYERDDRCKDYKDNSTNITTKSKISIKMKTEIKYKDNNVTMNVRNDTVTYARNVTTCYRGNVVNDGLWAIVSDNADTNDIYLSAGSQEENHGLLAVLQECD